tara:strand:+ start:328 stop:732 length:405 start_codon:yes stop_codon:yes gene_type:complete
MAGKLIADQIEHSTAGSLDTQYVVNGSAKCWANINGSGPTVFRDSFNCSSLTDAGTGLTFPISFTSSMSNANYVGSYYTDAEQNGTDPAPYNSFNNDYAGGLGSKTTASFGVASYSGAWVDATMNDAIIQGDLA